MCRKVALVAGIFVLMTAHLAIADGILLSDLYGSGVHAFYRGDYRGAHADLTAAIQEGSTDPRAYYFRGLAYLRLGREQEAIADFQKGAEHETGESAGVYSVSRSLERVQGPARRLLERYRASARVTAHQRQETQRQLQYQKRIAAEDEVLRKAPAANLEPTPKETPSNQPTASGEGNDPFATPAPTPSPKKQPAENANPSEPMKPTTEANPFEPPAPAPKPETKPPAEDSSDPFGGAPAPVPMAPPENKPAPGDDPFGAAAPSSAPSAPLASSETAPSNNGAANGATVKPTRNGLSGLIKSIAGVSSNASSGLLSALPDLSIPRVPGGFGGPAAAPPAPMRDPVAAAAPSDTPVSDDPFGSPPPSSPAPAPTPTPPGNTPPSNAEDPFAPPASGATPATPPSGSDDPFAPPAAPAQDKPAPTPSDDPFAN